VKQLTYLLSVLLAFAAIPAFAGTQILAPSQTAYDNNGNPIQYDSQGRPVERRYDNNGNLITDSSTSTNTDCHVIIENPIRMELQLTDQTCDQSGLVSGQKIVSGTVIGSPNNILVEISSTFVNGRPTGRTAMDSSIRLSFVGEMFLDGRSIGHNRSPNGQMYFGEMRSGQLWAGELTNPTAQGGNTSFYFRNRLVSEYEYKQFVNGGSQPEQPVTMSPEAALGYNSAKLQKKPEPISQVYTPQMVKVQPDDTICLADLPAKLFKIEGDFDGACKNGYYTGKASLKLTPLAGNTLPEMKVNLRYEAGHIIGSTKVEYPEYAAKFEGSLSNWIPSTGSMLEPIGNDNYRITDIQNGAAIAERTEYREPSFGKQFAGMVKGAIVRGLQDCLRGGCKEKLAQRRASQERKKQEEQAITYRVQAQSTAGQQIRDQQAAQQQTNDQAQADWQKQSDASIEDARSKAMAGLDRDGNPLPPAATVEVAQADTNQSPSVATEPVPAFGGGTSPPVEAPVIPAPRPTEVVQVVDNGVPAPQPTIQLDIQAPSPNIELGTRPQSDQDLGSTNPPEPSVPAPVQVANLPSPIIGDQEAVPPPVTARPVDLPAPIPASPPISEPVPVAGLSAPVSLEPTVAPPVQLGGGGDTLGTGAVPSNPVPQPVPVVSPTTPSQPVVDVASNQNSAPPSTPAVNQSTRPNVPYGLLPSGSSSTPAIVTNPVILRWSSVTGTDYYDFGISSEASGYRLVVDERVRDNFYSGNLSPGKYRWNLRACNRQNDCSAFTGHQYFEIPGAANAPQTITQTTLGTPSILEPNYQGELSQPVTLKWTRVTGANRYWVTVTNLAAGARNPAYDNKDVTGTIITLPILAQGTQFKWDVAACNDTGCGGISTDSYFRTVGSQPTKALTYEDVLTSRERVIFDEHFGYLALIPESNPPTKFTPDHIKRMKENGHWQPYFLSIEKDNQMFRDIGVQKIDYCGSGITSWVPDRILKTDISSACKKHDACYASSSTQYQCDIGIMKDIYAICRANKSSPTCYYAAYKYFDVLNQVGWYAYQKAQKNRR
jgi:hypothetical protein